MVLEYGTGVIILDAGSGLMQYDVDLRKTLSSYPNNLPFKPNILIGHLHLDHIIGLTGFAPIWAKDSTTRIFTNTRDDRPLAEQIFGVFTPPYWPAHMASVSYAECVAITGAFKVDGFTVTPFLAVHPDDTLCFHITDGYKSVVHLLDYEIPPEGEPAELLEYCNNADLVIFDAAYSQEDYKEKRGWGHSTVEHGIKLADKSGCKRMVFAHYGQEYSDDDLDKLKEIISDDNRFIFAYEGMQIDI